MTEKKNLGSEQEYRFGVRFTPELHRKFRIAIAERGIRSMQQAIEMAVRLWIQPESADSAPSAAASRPSSDLAPADRRSIDLLLEIRSSGDPQAVRALESGLTVLAKHVRLLREIQHRE